MAKAAFSHTLTSRVGVGPSKIKKFYSKLHAQITHALWVKKRTKMFLIHFEPVLV